MTDVTRAMAFSPVGGLPCPGSGRYKRRPCRRGGPPQMLTVRRRTRRLVPCTAAGALALAAVLVPASAQAVEPTHTIAQVQGTGAATTLAGTVVTVEGVVTADHRVGGYEGIYVQTADSGGTEDATPGASDGIFVYLCLLYT